MKIVPLLQASLIIAAKKDIRYYFNGVHLTKVDGVVKLQATDGHALSIIDITDPDVTQYIEEGTNVILERDCLEITAKALKKTSPTLIASIDGDVTLGGVQIKTIDGVFPHEKLNTLANEVMLNPILQNSQFDMSMLLLGRVAQAAVMISKSLGGDNAQFAGYKCYTSATIASAFTTQNENITVIIGAAPCRL